MDILPSFSDLAPNLEDGTQDVIETHERKLSDLKKAFADFSANQT